VVAIDEVVHDVLRHGWVVVKVETGSEDRRGESFDLPIGAMAGNTL